MLRLMRIVGLYPAFQPSSDHSVAPWGGALLKSTICSSAAFRCASISRRALCHSLTRSQINGFSNRLLCTFLLFPTMNSHIKCLTRCATPYASSSTDITGNFSTVQNLECGPRQLPKTILINILYIYEYDQSAESQSQIFSSDNLGITCYPVILLFCDKI